MSEEDLGGPNRAPEAAEPVGQPKAEPVIEAASAGDAALGGRFEPAADPARAAKDRIFELETMLADRERQVQRLAADFDNFRRRASAEKEDLIGFAASRVLENFLSILDNFERALAHARTGDPASILQGVELIYKQIQDFLTRHGVAAMDPVGQPFDPNLHEAIASMVTTEHPDHTVLAMAQKGYYLNGKVLRHAMVQVAENPGSPPQGSADDPEDETASKEESHG